MMIRSYSTVLTIFITIFCCNECLSAVTGAITDTWYQPVAGAEVIFTEESGTMYQYKATTDAGGAYTIDFGKPSAVDDTRPKEIILGQNYPNPFNPQTVIPYTLNESTHVRLTVYNCLGQKIATLVDEQMNAGSYSITWDGTDYRGAHVGAGVYLYHLHADNISETKKMLLLDGGQGISSSGSVSQKIASEKIATETLYTITVKIDGDIIYEQAGLEVEDGNVHDVQIIARAETPQSGNLTMVAIPGGTFEMGDVENMGDSDEKPVHTVTIHPFEMSAYEITNAQFVEYVKEALAESLVTNDGYTIKCSRKGPLIYGVDYLKFNDPESGSRITYEDGEFVIESGMEHHPVTGVTWYGAKSFAMFYGCDLPTEAEWEYACRGGKGYMYGTDDGAFDATKVHYDATSTIEVGSYPPNPFGLYDMSGNAHEWCHDTFGEYQAGPCVNPAAFSATRRIKRGGSFLTKSSKQLRSAYRSSYGPPFGTPGTGFRIVYRQVSK